MRMWLVGLLLLVTTPARAFARRMRMSLVGLLLLVTTPARAFARRMSLVGFLLLVTTPARAFARRMRMSLVGLLLLVKTPARRMRMSLVGLLLLVATPAHADEYGLLGKPEAFEPRIEPQTARWISLGTTLAGLGVSAYMWRHADGLEEGHGRAELQLASIGTGVAMIGIGPASGLLVAGEYRRAVSGALARPALVTAGALGAGVGAFVMMWGCFETNDCAGAKVGGGALIGLGAVAAAAGIGWAAYDVWDTPRILRERMPRRRPALRTAVSPIVGGDRVGLALTIVR